MRPGLAVTGRGAGEAWAALPFQCNARRLEGSPEGQGVRYVNA